MKLLLCTAGDDAADWVAELNRALGSARLDLWPTPEAQAADYALVWKPPQELWHELKRVKAVFNLGAGVDALGGAVGLRREAKIVRLEDAGMGQQMAEYVCHAVLRRYREFDVYAEQQQAGLWRPRPRTCKQRFDVGILGLGVLGLAVARALQPFGFPLRGWSRTARPIDGVTTFSGAFELDAFLAAADLLVCLLPLTPDTRGLLDQARLSRLPQGASVVNVSRGAVIDEEGLLRLLDSGHLARATLDVFADEPLPPGHRFWHHPRIALTPHVAAITQVEESVAQIAEKIRRLEAGLEVTGIVARDPAY